MTGPSGEAARPEHGNTVAASAVDTAAKLLRDRMPPDTRCLVDLVAAVIRDEVWVGPCLPLGDPSCTLRITAHAASAALRYAADAVPGVTAVSCRFAPADRAASTQVNLTLTAGLDRPLPETAELVRRSVVDTSHHVLGIVVTAVDIRVIDAHHPGM
ncbi:hypothetical protein [Streptomyces sp. NPDC048489]|uniref:hypothetical protein n=1 Tax=Streptomyces sp. NPDC048489 TaxID=3154504 RepID=UPI003430986C